MPDMAQDPTVLPALTKAGWALLLLSWSAIIALNVYCFSKVLGKQDNPEDR